MTCDRTAIVLTIKYKENVNKYFWCTP
jgi:hypothetical protein